MGFESQLKILCFILSDFYSYFMQKFSGILKNLPPEAIDSYSGPPYNTSLNEYLFTHIFNLLVNQLHHKQRNKSSKQLYLLMNLYGVKVSSDIVCRRTFLPQDLTLIFKLFSRRKSH